MLWTRFRVVSPGSEIVWKLSETVSCSRTTERAEKPWFQKRGLRFFFSAGMHDSMSKESNVFSKSVAGCRIRKRIFC